MKASSRTGCPTKVAPTPLALHIAASKGRIHRRWSINSLRFFSFASPDLQAQYEGAT